MVYLFDRPILPSDNKGKNLVWPIKDFREIFLTSTHQSLWRCKVRVSLYVAAILFVLSTIFTFVVYNCKCEKKDILSAPNVHNVIKEAIAKEMKVMTEKYSIVYNKDLNIHEPKTENEKELLTLFNFIIYYKKATNIDIKSIGQIIDILKSLNNNNLHT